MSSESGSNNGKIKLTYFDIEGAAEPVRLALVLANVDFDDDRVKFEDWAALKPNTPYGQLPMMTMNTDNSNEQLTRDPRAQSGAMLRYVASKYAPDMLYPANSLFDIEEVIGLIGDLTNSMVPMVYIAMRPEKYGYPAGFYQTDEGKALVKSLRETWLKEELPKFCGFLEKWLDKANGWLATSGEMPTLADCCAIPVLRRLTKGDLDYIPTNCLDEYPKITSYVKRFCALPQIQGRYKTGLY